MDNERFISLKGGDRYITEKDSDAFRVQSGTVLVFIVPLKGGEPGRRSFIYQASEKEVLPSFCYKDIEYVNWRFCFTAIDSAVLEVIPGGGTKILKEKFAAKARIKNYGREGFNGGIVDQYRINTVTEDGFIRRSRRERLNTSENILNLIAGSFGRRSIAASLEKSGSALYDSAAVLCEKQHINIAPFEKIKEACKGSFGISDVARISRFAYREIILEDGWEKRDSGAFLVFGEKDRPLVCLPKNGSSYILYDTQDGSSVPVSKAVAASLSAKAYMFYRPLPEKKLSARDLIVFCAQGIRAGDAVRLVLLTLLTSLIGLLTPAVSQRLYDEFIPVGSKAILFQTGCLIASFMTANILFYIVKNLVTFRMTSKMAYDVQNAVYSRLFSLPSSFFRRFESADTAQCAMCAGPIVNSAAVSVFSAAVAAVFSIVYLSRMFFYSARLALIGFALTAAYSLLYYVLSVRAIGYERRILDYEGQTESLMFQFIKGIAKIRTAGVEDRALYEYMRPYVRQRGLEARKKNITDLTAVIAGAAGSIFSMILYIVIIKGESDISVGSFIAFNAVFGSFSAYFLQMIESVIGIRNVKPAFESLKPILEEHPETSGAKELPGDLSGGIEINNVTFAYSPDSPNVLEGLTLDIKPGEYLGIVGYSGCGKSTLLKLLLGFERPTSGKIYYDNKDIDSLDKRELRKKTGVVLQDGKLIAGSIYDNITITAPGATPDDVRRVIKAVGLEKDIDEMPMGLYTALSEDCGTISGGQQQRILIARAIISDPDILFLDEATGSLDNLTQSIVTDTIEKMTATRIVIAHRLSTVMKCDRIVVLDNGSVAEQGTYDELMKKDGIFRRLAGRQNI